MIGQVNVAMLGIVVVDVRVATAVVCVVAVESMKEPLASVWPGIGQFALVNTKVGVPFTAGAPESVIVPETIKHAVPVLVHVPVGSAGAPVATDETCRVMLATVTPAPAGIVALCKMRPSPFEHGNAVHVTVAVEFAGGVFAPPVPLPTPDALLMVPPPDGGSGPVPPLVQPATASTRPSITKRATVFRMRLGLVGVARESCAEAIA